MSDKQLESLLVRVSDGDAGAFERLYSVIADTVVASVRAVVSDPDQAQDIAQEVALQLWRNAHRYDPSRSSVLSWVKLIAHHRAVDQIRTNLIRSTSETAVAHRATGHEAGPVEQVQIRFEHQAVRDALSGLTRIQHEAVVLAYFGGHTYRQVADLLNVPESTAKTRIRDGLIRIRQHLVESNWT
ncbi:sigma-70 family RNA polymerase sigma factor [Tenggerimyces flavus]|uniref:Sigma-70 family RNA polymerase sigma factor n=1 Tax=Tenggerimyces flavus TaxID=1708749 RepID=A0ABV7Y9Y4_9ACTN|nr:RNA polymerase sigma-70 factor (ECF subfamily) [Tenggerimyces flavus]